MKQNYVNSKAVEMNKSDCNKLVLGGLLALVFVFIAQVKVLAGSGPDLTLLFSTDAFQGAWETINKLNWVGAILNFIISISCAMGLFLLFADRVITMVYLITRNIFDQVSEIKNSNAGDGKDFLGFKAIGKNVMQKNGIFDAVMYFILSLLPDIKAITVYNKDVIGNTKYEESDTVSIYFIKSFIPTIMSAFFLTIGCSGTLAEGYGTVVSAMATFADNVVSVNLDVYVDKLFSVSTNPEYTLGQDGTKKSKIQKKVASVLFREAQKVANITDKQAKAVLLSNCEQKAMDICNENSSAIIASLGSAPQTDDDWGRLSVKATANASDTSSETIDTIALNQILPEYDGTWNIHLVYKSSAPTHNYLNIEDTGNN